MHHSLYPTDDLGLRDAVLAQAGADARVFTSLHIPEADALRDYVDWMRDAHEETGVRFFADVSPATFERLDLTLDDAALLTECGVEGLRLDFGLDADDARRLREDGGFEIAVNASTADARLLDDLADIEPLGWHNYYPRPETGLAPAFFQSQNRLFTERGLAVHAFVPGETSFRAPLHLGLPTLERHRGRPSYVAAVELRSLCPDVELWCAEGLLREEHAAWITHLEDTGEVTLPLVGLADGMDHLLEHPWRLRVEQTGTSQRLEGTRGRPVVAAPNAATRAVGSLQADLAAYGRYAGEVHLMTAERPLDPGQARIADVASPYVDLVHFLRGGDAVRFVLC